MIFIVDSGSTKTDWMIPGTEGQVWNLSYIDDDLFCGHDLGTFHVVGPKATKITNIPGAWAFKRHPKSKDL